MVINRFGRKWIIWYVYILNLTRTKSGNRKYKVSTKQDNARCPPLRSTKLVVSMGKHDRSKFRGNKVINQDNARQSQEKVETKSVQGQGQARFKGFTTGL